MQGFINPVTLDTGYLSTISSPCAQGHSNNSTLALMSTSESSFPQHIHAHIHNMYEGQLLTVTILQSWMNHTIQMAVPIFIIYVWLSGIL